MLTAFLNWVARQSPAFMELSERNKYLEERTRLAFEDREQYRRENVRLGCEILSLSHDRTAAHDAHEAEMAAMRKERDDRIAWLQMIVNGFESERKHLLDQIWNRDTTRYRPSDCGDKPAKIKTIVNMSPYYRKSELHISVMIDDDQLLWCGRDAAEEKILRTSSDVSLSVLAELRKHLNQIGSQS